MKDHVLIFTENKNHELLIKKKLDNLSLIFIHNDNFEEEKLSHLRFSFIILDESEGKKDIFSLINSIKGNPNTKAVPILVISNKLNKIYLEKLIHSGVANFIPMPIADENIYQTLLEAKSMKNTDEVIAKIKIPVIESKHSTIDNHQIVPHQTVKKIKEALQEKKSVTLALIATKQKPNIKNDLMIQVTKHVFCLISLTKDTKQLYSTILQVKTENTYAGIVSNDHKTYDNIASMINDAKNALARAKETPHGISFYTK